MSFNEKSSPINLPRRGGKLVNKKNRVTLLPNATNSFTRVERENCDVRQMELTREVRRSPNQYSLDELSAEKLAR